MRRIIILVMIILGAVIAVASKAAASPLETLMGLMPGEQAEVPIIMYHALEDSPDNRWEITAREFEQDLEYLSKNGYNAVVMQDLIDFVHKGKPLPQRPIVLSFDDGRSPTIDIILPMLAKYDARVTMAIIGVETQRYTELVEAKNLKRYPHMTWDDVNRAAKTGLVEITSHTYDLHGKTGARKHRGESEAAYKTRFLADLQKFAEALDKNTGLKANALVYPLGEISSTSDDVIKEAGYLASLSCREKNNVITVGDYDCLFSLNRFLRPPHRSSEDFFIRILGSIPPHTKHGKRSAERDPREVARGYGGETHLNHVLFNHAVFAWLNSSNDSAGLNRADYGNIQG